MTTAQSVFNQVAKHLLTQGIAAINPDQGNCVYRSSDGLMCAVGCLMDDDTYDPSFEGHSLAGVTDAYGDEALPPLILEHYSLLTSLQIVHDQEMPRFKITEEMAKDDTYFADNELYLKDMRTVVNELKSIAKGYNLVFDENMVPERFRHAG